MKQPLIRQLTYTLEKVSIAFGNGVFPACGKQAYVLNLKNKKNFV